MFKVKYRKHTLIFREAGGTSRGVLTQKDSYFIFLEKQGVHKIGIGECSIIPGLSIDDIETLPAEIHTHCESISNCRNDEDFINYIDNLQHLPALRFAFEMAFIDLNNKGICNLYPSSFTKGQASIPINGLVWMGDIETMERRAEEKVNQGYNCIKIKIGAQDFDEEIELLSRLRNKYGNELIIRVDANGAFAYTDCLEKLERLSELNIHSIEQPIAAGHAEHMEDICISSPLPVALDEELIGYNHRKPDFLRQLKPHYLILKPSLLGGFKECEAWIQAAHDLHIGWWVTSALESNLGLNAIAQWTYTLNNSLHQGLGTGQVFTNNIPSPLKIEKGQLYSSQDQSWDLSLIE